MRRNRCLGAWLGGLLLLIGPRVAWAQGPAIDHKPVACVVADKFAALEARFDPAENVSRARIYFRADGGPFWYFVDMKPQAGAFLGVIPKPKKSLKRINYYIDVLDKAFVETRTPDYSPEVVRDAGVCSKMMAVATAASPVSVAVGVSPGAPAVPAGFSAAGVTTAVAVGAAAAAVGAGGGIGTTALVLGGVAVAGGTAAVVVATKGGSSPTTTMVSCPACYAGNWQFTVTLVAQGPLCGMQSGPQTLNITVNADGTFLFPIPDNGCAPPGMIDASGNVNFALAGDTCLPPGSCGGTCTCPAGSGTGRCSTTTSCAGTASEDGDQFTWVMTR